MASKLKTCSLDREKEREKEREKKRERERERKREREREREREHLYASIFISFCDFLYHLQLIFFF